MANAMRPIHPGEVLRRELGALRISAGALAGLVGVPVRRIIGIVNETRAITADSALRLAGHFGTSPEFWLNLQQAYDLRRARIVRRTEDMDPPEIEAISQAEVPPGHEHLDEELD